MQPQMPLPRPQRILSWRREQDWKTLSTQSDFVTNHPGNRSGTRLAVGGGSHLMYTSSAFKDFASNLSSMRLTSLIEHAQCCFKSVLGWSFFFRRFNTFKGIWTPSTARGATHSSLHSSRSPLRRSLDIWGAMQKQQDWLGKAPRARDTNSTVLFSSVDETTPYFMKSSQRTMLAPESLVAFKNSGMLVTDFWKH